MQKLLLTLGSEVLRAKLYKIQKSGKSLIWGICTSEWLAALQNQHCNKCAHTKGSVAACSVWSLGGGGNSTWRCAQGQFTVLCKGHILFNWKYGTKSITLPYPRNFCAMICLLLLQYFNENAILPVGLLSYQDWEIKMTHRSCACAHPLLLELKPFCKTNMKFACFTTISVTMQFCYLVYLILIQINEKKVPKITWCFKRTNYSQKDNQANLNCGKPLNFWNGNKLNPPLGSLQLSATLETLVG